MTPFNPFSINIRGHIHEFRRPCIMGIVNVTPDSFFASSRTLSANAVEQRVIALLEAGADMLDIGAYSSRPGADDVSEQEETDRLAAGIKAVRRVAPDTPLSVDTFRAKVARNAISQMGADIINDISGGELDSDMFGTVAELKVPYILMHMRGTPRTMQQLTAYSDVTVEVTDWLSERTATLEQLGVSDVIVDTGFGFGKTVEQNYELLANLPHLAQVLNRPLLVGVSRKSMLTKPLGITPDQALQATTAANTIALMNGASILRVHDVEAARHALTIVSLTHPSS